VPARRAGTHAAVAATAAKTSASGIIAVTVIGARPRNSDSRTRGRHAA
jgi:hypothetical protein